MQGDVIKLIEADGTVIAEYTYNAWGEILTSSGTMAEINPLRYRGYYYDTETGFYYLQSRYYDPAMHRFINADSLASTGQGIVGTNMFAYCLNNPVRRIDASGTYSIGDIWEDFCDEIEDTVEGVCDAVSDAWEWSCGAAEDAWDWTCGAAEDAWDWTCGAVEDAWDWTCGAAEDAWDWTSGAVDDAWDWTCGVVGDAWDWTCGAVEDTWEWISNKDHLVGILECIMGISGIIGGACLLLAPEPTGISKVEGYTAIVGGIASVGAGILHICE